MESSFELKTLQPLDLPNFIFELQACLSGPNFDRPSDQCSFWVFDKKSDQTISTWHEICNYQAYVWLVYVWSMQRKSWQTHNIFEIKSSEWRLNFWRFRHQIYPMHSKLEQNLFKYMFRLRIPQLKLGKETLKCDNYLWKELKISWKESLNLQLLYDWFWKVWQTIFGDRVK